MVIAPLLLYTIISGFDKCTGINFIDSTKLAVCRNKRIYTNKVFKNVAKIGKSTVGWFYGFKLHLILDVVNCLTKNIYGKLFGDKGYISQKLFDELLNKNIKLVTALRKNMKPKLMSDIDNLLLRKRSLIETVNDFLKNICHIEHTRHRSPINFLANLL